MHSLGVVIREFPLSTGSADYMFFVDRKAVGVIEAKAEGTTLSGVVSQSGKYLDGFPENIKTYSNPLPFAYESTGVETFFRDIIDKEPKSKRLFALPSLKEQQKIVEDIEKHLSVADKVEIIIDEQLIKAQRLKLKALKRKGLRKVFNTYYVTKSADINMWIEIFTILAPIIVGVLIALLTPLLDITKYRKTRAIDREIEKLSDFKEKMSALYYEMMKYNYLTIPCLREYEKIEHLGLTEKETELRKIINTYLDKIIQKRLDYVYSWDTTLVYFKDDKTNEKLEELNSQMLNFANSLSNHLKREMELFLCNENLKKDPISQKLRIEKENLENQKQKKEDKHRDKIENLKKIFEETLPLIEKRILEGK